MKCSLILDFTVSSLIQKESLGDVSLLFLQPSPPFSLAQGLPRSYKYVSDQRLRLYTASETTKRATVQQRLEFAPQFAALIAGNMTFITFARELHRDADLNSLQLVLSQLEPQQRPWIQSINPHGPVIQSFHAILGNSGQLLTVYPHDWCDELPCVVPSSILYRLESKIHLCQSNLRSPQSRILHVGLWQTISTGLHRTQPGDLIISFEQFSEELSAETLPFVTKLANAQGGVGVRVLRNPDDRGQFLQELNDRLWLYQTEAHRSWTPKLTPVVIEEYVKADESLCVHFFVHSSDDAVILGITEQLFTKFSTWAGACINYDRQQDLEDLVSQTVIQIGRNLRTEGFVGIAGADLLLTEDGQLVIVDINPRINGSLPLCALKTHFTTGGYNRAILLPNATFRHENKLEGLMETLRDWRSSVVLAFTSNESLESESRLRIVYGANDSETVEEVNAEFERLLLDVVESTRFY